MVVALARLVVDLMRNNPLTITCPLCQAAPGKYCRSPNGHLLHPERPIHRKRYRAVGDMTTNRRRVDDDIAATALEPWPLQEETPGARTTIVFHSEAVADVRTLIERHFGETTKSDVTQFLHDLYNEGYMLVMVVDPT